MAPDWAKVLVLIGIGLVLLVLFLALIDGMIGGGQQDV